MSARVDLFPQAPRFRKPRQHLMHVIDAGDNDLPADKIWTRMRCRNCQHEEQGIRQRVTFTVLKRGLPCPECNPTPQAQE